MSEFLLENVKVESLKKDRKGFKVGGEWYSGFDELPVGRDDVISFRFTVKGQYKNLVKDSVTVISKGAPYQGGGGGNYKSGGGKGGFNQAGITAGMATNNAVLLIAHGKAELEQLPTLALKIAKVAQDVEKQLKGETAPAAPAQQAPAPQPAPVAQAAPAHVSQPVPASAVPAGQPAPAPAAGFDYDDSIPF